MSRDAIERRRSALAIHCREVSLLLRNWIAEGQLADSQWRIPAQVGMKILPPGNFFLHFPRNLLIYFLVIPAMEPTNGHELTQLLERMQGGDKAAESRFYELVMPDLRRLAQHLLNHDRPNHTLQGTELVIRMYVRLSGAKLSLRNRAHFFAIAGRAMRRELIDYARRRPDATFIPIDGLPESLTAKRNQVELTLIIDDLLEQLQDAMPTERAIVEMKLFFGMTDEQTAAMLGLRLKTMQARWQDARIWLFEKAEARQWRPESLTKSGS